MKAKNFTLIELLVYIAVFATIMNMSVLFFFDGTKICGDAFKSSEISQNCFLVRKNWRGFVKKNQGNFKIEDGGIVSSSANFAKYESGRLTICSNGEKRIFVFPNGTICSFKIEEMEGLSPFAVLEINYKKTKNRIVASYEKEK